MTVHPLHSEENSAAPRNKADRIDRTRSRTADGEVQIKAAPCHTTLFTNTIKKNVNITIPDALRPLILNGHMFHHIQLTLQIQKGMKPLRLLQATNLYLAMERNENINVKNVDNTLLDYIT
jgi:hypothetical protein